MHFLCPLVLASFLAGPPPAPLGAPALRHNLMGHASTVRGACFSPDGTKLATVGDDGQLNVWDVGGGKAVVAAKHAGGFGSVEYSRDGKMLLTAGTDRVVRLWGARTGKELKSFHGHTGAVYVACFTPDNKHVVSAGIDSVTRIWSVETGKEVRSLPSGTSYGLAVSPDGKYIVTAADGTLTLWRAGTGARVRSMAGHTGVVVWLAFSPDGKTIASAGYDHTVRLWETGSGKPRLAIRRANSPRVLMFSGDGRFLVEGNYDHAARVYDTGSGKMLFEDKGVGGSLYAAAISPGRRYVCGGGGGGGLRVWDVSAVTRRGRPGGEMTAAQFAGHWKALESAEGEEAYRAVVALAVPAATKYIGPRLAPPKRAAAPDLKRVPRLLGEMERDDNWRKAADELAEMGPPALPALRAALKKADDPDVKLRLAVTIRRADTNFLDERPLLRVVEALERLRSAEAVKLLEGLAKGARGKAAAEEAKQALARLRGRGAPGG